MKQKQGSMGAVKDVDVESAPLMTSSGYTAIPATDGEGQDTAVPSTRQWNGSLLACCGTCDFVGVGSCLLTKYLPCVAYGQNAGRAFRQSAWLHGLTYLALFMVAGWLSVAFLMSANHNVLAQCNGDLPAPGGEQFWLQPSHQWSAQGDWRDQGVDFASFRGLGDADEGKHHHHDDNDDDDHHHHDDGDHHHHDDDNDDDDDSHKHHHHEDKHGKKPCKGKKGQDTTSRVDVQGMTTNNVDASDKSTAISGLVNKPTGTIKAIGDYATRKMGPAFSQAGPADKRSPEEMLASPECHEAVMIYCSAWLAVLVSVLLAVLYAARRRTMLREKFGISGSKLGDFCAWCWCAPCALCQETRTLWTNNVHAGVWHGAGLIPAAPSPASAPASQFMTASA